MDYFLFFLLVVLAGVGAERLEEPVRLPPGAPPHLLADLVVVVGAVRGDAVALVEPGDLQKLEVQGFGTAPSSEASTRLRGQSRRVESLVLKGRSFWRSILRRFIQELSLSLLCSPSSCGPIQIMNRGGGAGAGLGSGSGPTAAAAVAAAQKQKTLLQRVENDIGSIVDNFSHLVNVARVNDPPVRNSQEAFMMEMRAARMVQAADSLLKLVSELKQTAIFSGFASLNDHVEQRIVEFNQQAEKSDRTLSRIAEEAAASLKELESHYYSSLQRTTHPTES